MKTTRRLQLPGIVYLVKGRVRGDLEALREIEDELEPLLDPAFFESTRFEMVTLMIRFGVKTSLTPLYQGIHKRELQIAVEEQMRRLRKMTPEELKAALRWIVLNALIHVAETYNLPREALVEAKARAKQAHPELAEWAAKATWLNAIDPMVVEQRRRRNEMWIVYKDAGKRRLYCEAWEGERRLVVHWGTVGEIGDIRVEVLTGPEVRDALAEGELSDLLREGYSELDMEDQFSLEIEFKVKGMGTEDDLNKRNDLERALDDLLGWTGNGYCEGSEIGSGTMTVFAEVLDPAAAAESMVRGLADSDLLEGAVISVEKDDEREVLWPRPHLVKRS